MDRSRRRRRRVRRAALLLSLLAGPLVAELVLRHLIFGNTVFAREHGASYRDAALYANGMVEDDYWKLRYLLSHPERDEENRRFDPLVGWRSELIRRETYKHRDQKHLRGRRPVLLYGASFAKGYDKFDSRFENLLEETEAADEFRILNYAVHGHGIDQAFLLLQKSVPQYADLDPVIVIGLALETDLDRAAMSFRTYPKPRLVMRDRGLEPEQAVLSVREHLQREPLGIRSYAWRFLLHGTDVLPTGLRERLAGIPAANERKRELLAQIIAATAEIARAHDLECFYWFFHNENRLRGKAVSWQESFLLEQLGELGVPHVGTREVLLRAADEQGVAPGRFYAKRHLNAAGNRVVLDTLVRGLRGEYDRH